MRGATRIAAALLACGLVATACGPAPDPPGAEPAEAPATQEEAPEPDPAPEPEHDDAEPPAEEPAAGRPDGELEVHFLDVGQADATLLLHDEAAVLIDAGHWQRSDVVPYVRAQGVQGLDLVVVTHPHADHIGQFDQVLAGLEVDEVWWSGSVTTTLTFERAVAALEASDAAYEEPRAGDTTSIGPLSIEVVNPPVGVDLSDLHDAGLSMRIGYGDVRFLFTGDAEQATERRMVADHGDRLTADVLQVGHHGSRTSTTAAFLDAVRPAVAVYSAGEGNQYGHPHDEVIQRLDAAGVEVYGTDVHGTVVARTDGDGWHVDTDGEAPISADPPVATGDDEEPDPEPAEDEPDAASDACAPGRVDINTAGVGRLQEIIHIGPDRAQQILKLRPLPSVRAMDRIGGIGPARLDDIIQQGVACAS